MNQSPWIDRVQAALDELAQEYDPSLPKTNFKFHPLYRVGVSAESSENLKKIFGYSMLGRIRHYSGNIFKLDWIKNSRLIFSARIPSDSVIFFREDKEGLIIASLKREVVLKIFFSNKYINLLNQEIETLKRIKGTDFEAHTANLIFDGKTSGGGRWLITKFYANTNSIKNRLFHEKYLLQNLEKIVMPAMTSFYKNFEPQIQDLKDWIIEAKIRIQTHPEKSELVKLLSVIENEEVIFSEYQLVKAIIHHDLHAGNILMNQNQAVIIDWEGAILGPVLIDVLDFSRRYIMRNKIIKFTFFQFLKGKCNLPPHLIGMSLNFYRKWMKDSFGATIPEGSEKLSFYVYTLERILILHELRNMNRVEDKSGFEAQILSSL